MQYEQRLRKLNLFSNKPTRLRADLVLAFKIVKGESNLKGTPTEYFKSQTLFDEEVVRFSVKY